MEILLIPGVKKKSVSRVLVTCLGPFSSLSLEVVKGFQTELIHSRARQSPWPFFQLEHFFLENLRL